MKTIKFTRLGVVISDFEISKFVDEMLASNTDEFHVGTSLIIDEIRARIKEGSIGINDLEVWVEDTDGELVYFNIDKNGKTQDMTETLRVHTNILTRLIKP